MRSVLLAPAGAVILTSVVAGAALGAGLVPVAGTLPLPAPVPGETRPAIQVKPKFPPVKAYWGHQACVNVAFKVGADGSVSGATVWSRVPYDAYEYDAVSTRAVSELRFRPRVVQGKAVATEDVHQEVAFYSYSPDPGEAAAVRETLRWLCGQPLPHGVSIVAGRAGGTSVEQGSGGAVAVIPAGLVPPGAPPGRVRLRFCVDATGRVIDTVVDDSQPSGLYGDAARAALAATGFTARRIGSAAVMTCGLNALASFGGGGSGKIGRLHDMEFHTFTEKEPQPKLVAQKPVPIALKIPPGTPLPKVARVEVRMCIEKDGEVSGARVVQADPPKYFDRAALATVAGWRFASIPRPMCDVYQWVRFPLGSN